MRAFEEINQEYGHTCAQMGSLYFEIEQLQEKIVSFKEKLIELTAEAKTVKDAEKSVNPDLVTGA